MIQYAQCRRFANYCIQRLFLDNVIYKNFFILNMLSNFNRKRWKNVAQTFSLTN